MIVHGDAFFAVLASILQSVIERKRDKCHSRAGDAFEDCMTDYLDDEIYPPELVALVNELFGESF